MRVRKLERSCWMSARNHSPLCSSKVFQARISETMRLRAGTKGSSLGVLVGTGNKVGAFVGWEAVPAKLGETMPNTWLLPTGLSPGSAVLPTGEALDPSPVRGVVDVAGTESAEAGELGEVGGLTTRAAASSRMSASL